jgi:hypothetical protein
MGLEPLCESCLLEDRVGCVSRLDLLIDDKSAIRDRTEPNLVVAFAVSLEPTIVIHQ